MRWFRRSVPLPRRMAAGLLRREGEVLLCHRRPDRRSYPDVWDLPGGHVEEGEEVADTLVRELAEELGIDVARPSVGPWKIVGVEGGELHVFVVDRWVGEPRNVATDEHDDIRWVSVTHLPALDLADERYLDLLRQALG